MSYRTKPSSISSPSLDSISLSSGIKSKSTISGEFYEIEPAVVLDIILDSDHEYFKNKKYKLTPSQWPTDIVGKPPTDTDLDYTWVGKALVRLLYTQRSVEKENLIWAMPLESNVSEYPVLNEIVGVVFYLGQYYYTKKINVFNTPNANADFNIELTSGGFRSTPSSPIQGNRELKFKPDEPNVPYAGPLSKLNKNGDIGYSGVLGRYFCYNTKIRSLKRHEGDLIFESRFGQSIRFSAYDDDREKDKSSAEYADYKGNGVRSSFRGKSFEAGGGNPMIIIRNRQRPLNPIKDSEKNVGGYMAEDINNDGSSIHMTSGLTLSEFKTTCFKKMWGTSEEQSAYQPPNSTTFTYPKLLGDQIVINSDRIIISSKRNEMFQYSKKRMSFVTDDEYTVDAHNQIIITTNNKTILNSPSIYLGEYNQTSEPVLLGQTTVNWLYDLSNWLLNHTHWYKHTHPDAGSAIPDQTQTPVQRSSLLVLRDNLNLLMSRRVFVVGGGFAPGANGGEIPSGVPPVNISIPSGNGVPGGWNSKNKR